MNELEIRITLAEVQGLKGPWIGRTSIGGFQYKENLIAQRLPELTLDWVHEIEMQEMEKTGAAFQATYLLNLQIVCERTRRDLNREQLSVWMMCATKEQRAEAILRTLGKWTLEARKEKK